MSSVTAKSKFTIKHEYLPFIFVSVLIILSSIVRLSPVFLGTFPFLFDHGRDYIDVLRIANGSLTLIGPFSGIQGVFHGPLHYYLLLLPFLATGGNPAAGTAFLGLLYLMGIALIYVFSQKMHGHVFAIFTSLFFALGINSVRYTVHLWNPYWIPFFMIFYFYFLYRGLQSGGKWWFGVGVIISIICQFEIAFGLFLIPSVFFTALVVNRNRLKTPYFYAIIPLFLLSFLPQALFELRHEFLMSKSIIQFISGKNISLGESIPFSTRFFYRIDEINKATVIGFSGISTIDYTVLAICVAYVLFLIIKRDSSRYHEVFIFAITIITYFVVFLLYPRPAWSWYWVGLSTAYYFFVAYVFAQLVKINAILRFAVFSFVLITFCLVYRSYFGNSEVVDKDAGTYRNQMIIVDEIYQDAQDNRFGVYIYTPPLYDYSYQYLFWWKGQQIHKTSPFEYSKNKEILTFSGAKTGFIQKKPKEYDLIYLIGEVDENHRTAYDEWKKANIPKGRVQWDKMYRGSIRVEKIYLN